MINGSTKDRDSSTKASSGSESSLRKFTLSCSRCRASKLKCDKNEPCMECLKRNIGHLCTKDERQPRAKRAKTDHNTISITKTNALQDKESEAEEAANVLEHFVDGTSREPTLSLVAPDYPNLYWLTANNPQRQGEKFALIREIVDVMPEPAMIHLLCEVFVTRCQGPLGNIVHAPTFMKQVESFCACLGLASPEAQVIAVSSTISMDTLACHLLALMLALAFHPTPSLLGWSPTPLTLRVEELRASDVHSRTWRSLALRCIQGRVSLFCGSIATLQAAIMLLLDGQEESLALDAILVTAIAGAQKLGLHGLGDARLEAYASPTSSTEDDLSTATELPHIRTEIGIRIWWALVMRDWSRRQTLGYYSIHPSQFNTRMPLHINDDDLCPTTLRINVNGHVTERPRSEFTMLSYTVNALQIAMFARESIDLRGPLCREQGQEATNDRAKMRNHLNKRYEDFIAGLPSYFRLGSTVGNTSTGPMAAIPVQRWMLHQQLWSLFLRIHRASLSSQDGRTSCQLLAQNIISTQAQIQVRCAVCGSLSTSETQVFNAAIVLLVDLLFSSKHKDADRSSAQLNRLMTRDKIWEAIELLRTPETSPFPQDPQVKASAQRSIIALEALMNLEEEDSDNNDQSSRAKSRPAVKPNSPTKIPLKTKITHILTTLQQTTPKPAPAATATQQARSTSPSTTDLATSIIPSPTAATDGSPHLDVLPLLSNNDPTLDFEQFFDFDPPLPSPPPPQSQLQYPTANGSFPGMADSQVPAAGSMPSPGDEAHSW